MSLPVGGTTTSTRQDSTLVWLYKSDQTEAILIAEVGETGPQRGFTEIADWPCDVHVFYGECRRNKGHWWNLRRKSIRLETSSILCKYERPGVSKSSNVFGSFIDCNNYSQNKNVRKNFKYSKVRVTLAVFNSKSRYIWMLPNVFRK